MKGGDRNMSVESDMLFILSSFGERMDISHVTSGSKTTHNAPLIPLL